MSERLQATPGDGPVVDADPEAGLASRRAAVGARLRDARHTAGLSQAQAAGELRLAQTSVSALERGLYLPDETTWSRLVEAYELDDDTAAALWDEVRAARRLRGAAAGGPEDAGPPDPTACSRRAWCGAVRRHHRLTRAELAEHLGVTDGAVAKLEAEAGPLPSAVKPPTVLRALAALGGTDERTLRVAWQPEEVAGIEHLLGLDGAQVPAAAAEPGELLRWLLATGHTQAELAEACGVSRPAVSQWLSGRTHPAPARLAGLTSLLGVAPGRAGRRPAHPQP
jgi:transcriptional regulator with XRE-family HTH domain